MMSSIVVSVETALAARRAEGDAGARRARELMTSLALVGLQPSIVATASSLTGLRALDAIHLATVLSIRDDLDGFVTYDRRLAAAAATEGLVVLAPA